MLAHLNALQQPLYIEKMDEMVKEVVKRIANPGVVASFTLRLIRKSEYEDIARTIELIETTIAETPA